MGVFSQLIYTMFWFVFLISEYDTLAAGKKKFCSINLFENNHTWLEFTKEINTLDYVTLERYKFMSCCAKNYARIEWYKDDKLITMESSFLTFNNMDENNQTLFSRRVTDIDNGTYTCKIYNNSNHMINHTIKLTVVPDTKYMGPALLTYPSPEVLESDEHGYLHMHEYAEVGDTKRLLCEGFVGYNNELISQAVWVFEDNTFVKSEDGHRYTTDIRRDDNMTIGQYLNFKSVAKEDFTTYICTISNGHHPKEFKATLIEGVDPRNIRTAVKPTLIVIAVFICTGALTLTVYKRWHLEIRLFWKDRFGKIEDGNKEYDIFVCYDQSDAEFTLGVIVNVLENVYNYKCFAYERDSIAGEWMPEIYTMKIKSSQRFLMVLSRALAVNNWCTYALYVAIEAMLNLHSKIIFIELEDISWSDMQYSANEVPDLTLQRVLKVIRKVRWQPAAAKKSHSSLFELLDIYKSRRKSHASDSDTESLCEEINYGSKKFWTSLRIHLPPKRTTVVRTLH
ncbi:hypothetical protein L9F63_011621 [Diploptera punctata]|uniref:Soluble interferon alpha/beta receptor OPG204 n=1 Tax=Diploptera punctata TaxID=6984 RepID=A0AAD8EPR2_DIPPU|nr:hypothetical protein L9F63_011621 [Diploptera punctata]